MAVFTYIYVHTMYILLPQKYEKIDKNNKNKKIDISTYQLNNKSLSNIGKESQANENVDFVIHNHEVGGSSPPLAT
jgi:hypothetical protein